MDPQVDEYCGLRVGYYVNLAAHEYLYNGAIRRAVNPASYSGYQEDMYREEYYEANPVAILYAQ